MWRLLIETAVQRKSENVAPNLAGEWLRSILTGNSYPLTLLSILLMRLRADHHINGPRVAILKAVLIRNFAIEVPVSLDVENRDTGYLLGRLFAAYEYAQTQALGGRANTTIRDQYYGTLRRHRVAFSRYCSGRRRIISRVSGRTAPGSPLVWTEGSARFSHWPIKSPFSFRP
jgi:CRISPR-associated protein Csd1